jgi:hypothetical protein
VCDSLQGDTKGQRFGGGFDGFGYVITAPNTGIVYSVPTIVNGYFEFEATGLHNDVDDGEKWKIFAMFDGDWASADFFRVTAEQRLPPRYTRVKFLNGSGCDAKTGCGFPEYIEGDLEIHWDPNAIYKLRLEWGGRRMRFIVTNQGTGQQWVMDEAYHYNHDYTPANHKISIGNPSAGGGAHSSLPGWRVRNVRIGRN